MILKQTTNGTNNSKRRIVSISSCTPQWVSDNRNWISLLPKKYQDAINKHEAGRCFLLWVYMELLK